jgi:RraA family protein
MSLPKHPQWPLGFALNPILDRIPIEEINGFQGIPSAAVSDSLGRLAGSIGLTAYHGIRQPPFAGPAITVRVRPGDNLMIHQAILMARPGDVIVVDGGGCVAQALVGGLMRTSAIARGVAAFVIDGAIRDLDEWIDGGIAVLAKGHTPRGPSKDGPGEVNVPISCAGLSVSPGDLVIGDRDGAVAVPAGAAADTLQRTQAHLTREAAIRAANTAGATDVDRILNILRSKGCPV